MTLHYTPLFGLFYHLRQAGFPLGADDYLLALKAVQAGFGLSDEQALYRLCRALWTTSRGEENQFKRIFEQHLTEVRRVLPETSAESEAKELAGPEPEIEDDLLDEKDELVDEFPLPSSGLVGREEQSDLALDFDEAMQVAQAALIKSAPDSASSRFILKPAYLPVTLRQMKRIWRYLRRFSRTGPPVELDVEATIQEVSRQGIFRQPVLRPRRTNQSRVVLMLDQGGSMTPFHLFSQQLVYSALRGGRLHAAGVYYFHNAPLHYLYTDPARLHGLPVEQVLSQLAENTAVLIFSDAGAARRSYHIDRILQIERFLQVLKRQVRYCAWLNPMPNDRWPGSSAAEIARFIPMFELSRPGLEGAISALRGQGHYWEKLYAWMR